MVESLLEELLDKLSVWSSLCKQENCKYTNGHINPSTNRGEHAGNNKKTQPLQISTEHTHNRQFFQSTPPVCPIESTRQNKKANGDGTPYEPPRIEPPDSNWKRERPPKYVGYSSCSPPNPRTRNRTHRWRTRLNRLCPRPVLVNGPPRCHCCRCCRCWDAVRSAR